MLELRFFFFNWHSWKTSWEAFLSCVSSTHKVVGNKCEKVTDFWRHWCLAIFCIMTKDLILMIICFEKYTGLQGCAWLGRSFTLYVSSVSVHQRKQGLLKSKTRGCNFMQLIILKETREIILLLSQVVWSPLQGAFCGWFWMQMSFDLQVRFSLSRRTISAFVWLGPLCATGFVCIRLSWVR